MGRTLVQNPAESTVVASPSTHVALAVGLAVADVASEDAVRQLRETVPDLVLGSAEEQCIRAMRVDEDVQDRALGLLEAATRCRPVPAGAMVAAPDTVVADRHPASSPESDGAALPSERRPPARDPLDDIGAAVDRVWRRVHEVADVGELRPDLELVVSEAFSDELRASLDSVLQHVNTDWVSFASHELRNPLAVVASTLETLLERGGALEAESRQALLRRAGRQALAMQRIIDQLVRAQAIETGAFDVHPRPTNLRELVETVIADYGDMLEGVEVEVRAPHGPVSGLVEPFAAAEILVALLRNAIDHAPCDEPVLIEVVPVPHMAMVAVHDDGPGVSVEDREQIFERGARLSGGGQLGLGLFVARSLARAHGGSLTVGDSPRLGGARFELLVPADTG